MLILQLSLTHVDWFISGSHKQWHLWLTSYADIICWHYSLTFFCWHSLLTLFFVSGLLGTFFGFYPPSISTDAVRFFWTQSFFQKTWSFLGGHGRFLVGTWSLSRQWWPLLTIIATRPTSLPGRSEDLWGFLNWRYLGETEEKQLQYKGRKRTSFSHNEWINISYHTINPVGTPM
jgi:hypothetical protein